MKYLDLSFIRTHVSSDPAFIRELLLVFQRSLDVDMQALNEALDSSELEDISRKAHKLKSSFRTLGITDLQNLLETIEQTAKINASLAEIKSHSDQLFHHLPALKVELEAAISSL